MQYISVISLGLHVPLLIAYHFNGHEFIGLVVQTFEDLPKGAFPNHFKHFKPVANVVMQHLEEQEEEHINTWLFMWHYMWYYGLKNKWKKMF